MNSTCSCGNLWLLAAVADVQIVRSDGVTAPLPDTCLNCGTILGSTTRVRNDYLRRLRVGRRIGQNRLVGPGQFRLPEWTSSTIGTMPQVSHRLFNDWRGFSSNPALFRSELHSRLGLSRNGALVARSQLGVPWFSIDGRLTAHLLKADPENLDNHIRYAPLIVDTLSEPDEVWRHDHGEHLDQFDFLRRYMAGSQVVTHMVCGDSKDEFVRSSYRLRDSQAEGKRHGIFMHAAYALNPK